MRRPSHGMLVATGALVVAVLAALSAFMLSGVGLEYVGSFILAATIGGPAALLLPKATQVTSWGRFVDRALVSLVAGLLAVEVSSLVAFGRILETGPLLFTIAWGGLVVAAILKRRRDVHLLSLGLAVLLGVLPFTRAPIVIAAFVAQGLLLIAISGVRVSARDLIAAAFAATSVFVVGLAGAILAYGRAFPPALSLDENATIRIIVPLLVLVGVVFLATLAWRTAREPPNPVEAVVARSP